MTFESTTLNSTLRMPWPGLQLPGSISWCGRAACEQVVHLQNRTARGRPFKRRVRKHIRASVSAVSVVDAGGVQYAFE